MSLIAFAALAVLGALRWGTLMTPSPSGRLLGLAALAVVVTALMGILRGRGRRLVLPLTALALVALLPLAGMPLTWLLHLRLAAIVQWLGDGLGTLPTVLVPYDGNDLSVRAVITLGAGLLLLAGALLLGGAPRPHRGPWLAAVGLPLVCLIAVPSTLLPPRHPYLQGLILFGLLAALVFAERLRGPALPLGAGLAALAGAVALLAAPGLDPHRAWIDVRALGGGQGGALEQFDFAQRLGRLNWPRSGRVVFDVVARRPALWKAVDLDLFDGRGFVPGIAAADPLPTPDAAALARFTETLTVTIRAMESQSVIAAGEASPPQGLRDPVQPGTSPGTWAVPAGLSPGDSYSIRAYSPLPTGSELARAGSPPQLDALGPYRSMLLPSATVAGATTPILFPAFHGGTVSSLAGSPYARSYRLARRLAGESVTPYDFVQRVMSLLHHGYRYDERPPPSRFPLEYFLFDDRRGYCQQFSGAMALLLRMGGVPARVAGGFTSGTFDHTHHRWVVSDLDAHDWVEVWFPHLGWVPFDPTPGADPARRGSIPLPVLRSRTARPPRTHPARARPRRAPEVRTARIPRVPAAHHPASGSAGLPLVLVIVLLLVLGGAGAYRLRPVPDADGLVAELERALRRSGRPAAGTLTLAALEHRLREEPAAARYVRALRLSRFAGASTRPTAAERRALRGEFRRGLGVLGWLRALWALPPRRMG